MKEKGNDFFRRRVVVGTWKDGLEYSVYEARKAAELPNLDIYHKELMLWLCDKTEELTALETGLHDSIKVIRSQHDCNCEVCSTISAVCPATASSYAMEILQLRETVEFLKTAMRDSIDRIGDNAVAMAQQILRTALDDVKERS